MNTCSSSSPVQILLVEDNPGDELLVQIALRESAVPVEVNVVEDGVQALAYLHRQGAYARAVLPDLMLLDLKLPRKGGLEVLAEIKDDPALRRIPVMILTTSFQSEDVMRAYDLQASAYITKPEDLQEHRKIVAALREFCLGTIELPPRLESQPTSGQAVDEPQRLQRGEQAGKSGGQAPRPILVVDDDHDTADSLATILNLATPPAEAVYDGHTALALAVQKTPRLVFLDLAMPNMDGLVLTRKLRGLPAMHDALLVCMTGLCGIDYERLALEAGCDRFLAKPVEPQEIERIARATADSRRLHTGC